jgi:hypothetical protein
MHRGLFRLDHDAMGECDEYSQQCSFLHFSGWLDACLRDYLVMPQRYPHQHQQTGRQNHRPDDKCTEWQP